MDMDMDMDMDGGRDRGIGERGPMPPPGRSRDSAAGRAAAILYTRRGAARRGAVLRRASGYRSSQGVPSFSPL